MSILAVAPGARDRVPTLASNSNLYDLICSFGISVRVFREKPPFYRLTNVYTYFIDRFALRNATWQRRNFGPESAFVGRMKQDLKDHAASIDGQFSCGKLANVAKPSNLSSRVSAAFLTRRSLGEGGYADFRPLTTAWHAVALAKAGLLTSALSCSCSCS